MKKLIEAYGRLSLVMDLLESDSEAVCISIWSTGELTAHLEPEAFVRIVGTWTSTTSWQGPSVHVRAVKDSVEWITVLHRADLEKYPWFRPSENEESKCPS